METQVVPQINTIKVSGQLFYLYSTLITALIKGNKLQNTFQVVCAGVCGSHSNLTEKLRQIILIHSTLPLFPSPAHGPAHDTKGEDYRKSGKTKLITGGISTSQHCLKCNYMGLELRLRLEWLQMSHWQTCPRRKLWPPLKMTADNRCERGWKTRQSCPSKHICLLSFWSRCRGDSWCQEQQTETD